jgi:hypothetical protein
MHHGAIEVRLSRGRSLVVAPEFDTRHLRALLSVLEAEALSRSSNPSFILPSEIPSQRSPVTASAIWRNPRSGPDEI